MRIGYFDFLRGLAIIMVIGIHSYKVAHFGSILGDFSVVTRELLELSVPIFLTISGFFIGQKSINSRQEYCYFLSKQVPRVYVPMLLWSIPIVILQVFSGKGWFIPLISGVLCASFGPYYFILLIIQLYLLHPIIKRASYSLRWGGVIIIIINLASYLLFNFLTNYHLPFVLLVSPFIYWISFYYLGVTLSQYSRCYSIKIPLLLFSIGFLSSLVISYLKESTLAFKGINDLVVSWLYSISSWSWQMGALLILFSEKTESLYKKYVNKLSVITKIGELSFGIYLSHVYAVTFVRDTIGVDVWLLRWIILLLISVSVVLLLRKVVPTRYKRFLGI